MTEYVAGHHWEPHEIDRGSNVQRFASAIRQSHLLQVRVDVFDPFELGLHFCDSSCPLNSQCIERVHAIWKSVQNPARCVCHNDLVRGNFIDDGEHLRFLDWECAA